jgi:hypothetical protein
MAQAQGRHSNDLGANFLLYLRTPRIRPEIETRLGCPVLNSDHVHLSDMTVYMTSSSVHLPFVIQHGGKIKPKIGPKVIHILLALEKLFSLLKFVVFIETCFPIKSSQLTTC